jgi:hypothetical protein
MSTRTNYAKCGSEMKRELGNSDQANKRTYTNLNSIQVHHINIKTLNYTELNTPTLKCKKK